MLHLIAVSIAHGLRVFTHHSSSDNFFYFWASRIFYSLFCTMCTIL